MSSDRCTSALQNLCATSQWRLSAIARSLFLQLLRLETIFLLPPPSTFFPPSIALFSNAPHALPPPSVSSSSTLSFDVNCPIISHWPRRGSGGVSSTGVDVYIYTLYGARFQPTALTHKAKKRSHFLAPLRKQRKDHGSNRVVQSGSWTLNHNKHFFLTWPCSENRGRGCGRWVESWRKMRCELVWLDRMQADCEVDINTKLTQESLCVHNFLGLRWRSWTEVPWTEVQ